MLPEWKALKKQTKKLEVPNEEYFIIADEYVILKDKFFYEDTIAILYSWFDMILYPIYIVFRLCMLDLSPTYLFTLIKTYQVWSDWLRLQELEKKVETWKTTVRSVGGPWISCNNPDYHVFVYADGMERIRYSRAFLPSQKTVKKSPKVQLPAQLQVSSPLKSPSTPSEVPLTL